MCGTCSGEVGRAPPPGNAPSSASVTEQMKPSLQSNNEFDMVHFISPTDGELQALRKSYLHG